MKEAFDPAARSIVVRARLTGPNKSYEAMLALDTGASTTVIDPRLLIAIGHDPARAKRHVFITSATSVAHVPKVTIDALEALGLRREQVPVIATSLPPSAQLDGVLGLDFLRNKRLTIDFRSGRIELR